MFVTYFKEDIESINQEQQGEFNNLDKPAKQDKLGSPKFKVIDKGFEGTNPIQEGAECFSQEGVMELKIMVNLNFDLDLLPFKINKFF